MPVFQKSTSNRYIKLVVTVNQRDNSIDAVNNTSTLDYRIELQRDTSYAYNRNKENALAVNIDGRNIYYAHHSYDLSNKSSELLIEGNTLINHNSDGTKKIAFDVSFNTNTYGSINNVGGTVVLQTIPRSSSFEVEGGEFGKNISLEITKAKKEFRHTAKLKFANKDILLGTKVDTSLSYLLPLNLVSSVTNSASASATIILETYNGTQKLGETTQEITLTVPESVKPTIRSLDVSERNSKVSAVLPVGYFLQNVSQIQASLVGAAGNLGSTISSYTISFNSVTKNQQSATFTNTDKSGTLEVIGTVTDSRGRTATLKKTITVLEYALPKIIAFLPARSGSGTNTGVRAVVQASVSDLTLSGLNNQINVKIDVSERGSNSYVTKYNQQLESNVLAQTLEIDSDASLDMSYDVRLTLSDKFNSVVSVSTIGTAEVLMALGRSRIGINMVPEIARGIQSKYGYFGPDGKPVQHHQLTKDTGFTHYLDQADLNSLKVTGYYFVTNATNWPAAQNGYVLVISYSDKYVYQRYTLAFSGRTYERLLSNGNWGSWAQISQVVTNWISTGVSGVFYKTDGTTVHLRANVRSTANAQNVRLGSVPRALLPHELMFNVPVWSLDTSHNKRLQINTDGSIVIIQADANQEFRFNVSWGV